MSFSGSVEDRLEIRELMDTYADGVNQRSVEIWGSTWAEDSEWNLTVVPGMEEIEGKANILKAWEEFMTLFPSVFMGQSVGKIDVNDNTAVARTYTAEVTTMQDGTELRPQGQHNDRLDKIKGKWLFVQPSFNLLHGE